MGNRTWAAATRETSIRVFGVKEDCCERKEGRIEKIVFLTTKERKEKKENRFVQSLSKHYTWVGG